MHTLEKPRARTMAIILATLWAVAAPTAQAVLHIGLSAKEFAADGDQTLRAAPYAFAIWSLIYLALALYAFYQARRTTPNSEALEALGWPSVGALIGIGLWIFASAFDWKAVSVVVILGSTLALLAPLWRLGNGRNVSRDARRFMVWPLALLAGWLTIASALNVLTEVTAWGIVDERAAPVWAGAGVLAIVAVAVLMVERTRLVLYVVPIAWGLLAVYVAERDHRPAVALMAAVASVLVIAFALLRAFQRRESLLPTT